MSYDSLSDFLEPINKHVLSEDMGYKERQIGKLIKAHEEYLPEVDDADIVLIGCNEQRGGGNFAESTAADAIRKEFYNLYYWHNDIKLVDAGNVRRGKNISDSYAALKMVIHELMELDKLVVILGGSHDLTLAQYHAFADKKRMIDAVGVDAVIDINL